MTTKPKSQAGVIAGNMLITDLISQAVKGEEKRPYSDKEMAAAMEAVQTDQEYADYNNRLQVRNFLLDMISRGRLALVEIKRNCYALTELCIRLQTYLKLDTQPVTEYYTPGDYLKATNEKLELYYKGADGQEKATTLLPFALAYMQTHPGEYAKQYGQPLDAQEIAYFREIVGLDITDKGVVKPTEAQRNEKALNDFIYRLEHSTPNDKEKIQKIVAYWENPKTIQTGTGKESYTYTKDELLPHLERYIEYLRNKGDTNAIKSTLEHFSKAIQDSIAHIQNKALQTEIKRLSAMDLATKEYHLRELADYYGVDFRTQAWGYKNITITADGTRENTREATLNDTLYIERPQKINFAMALEAMEAHLEFCKGYNLMMTLLQEYTGADMKSLFVDIDELEAGIKSTYTLVALLAKNCLITGEKEIWQNLSTESQVKVETIKHALLKTKKQTTESKTTLDERTKQLREMLALDNKKAKPTPFEYVQNQFFAVAMGVYYKWN